jgi:DNA-binding SARP family transcriptional activator
VSAGRDRTQLIRLRILGPVELFDPQGRELRAVLAQPKRLALLATLVVGPKGFRRRDSLLALLWPELDINRARAAMNQAVRFLRKELGATSDTIIISRGAEEIGVDPSALWCDAIELRDHMDTGRFSEALELYHGNLLEGFHGEPGAAFQDWLARERELLRATAARAARELAAAHERSEHFTPAVASARRAVELAEADERVVRELLLLLDRIGDRAGAVQAYEAFASRLAREYDVRPAPETQAVIDRIKARVASSDVVEESKAEQRHAHPAPTRPLAVVDGNGVAAPAGHGIGAPSQWLRITTWIVLGASLGAGATLLMTR